LLSAFETLLGLVDLRRQSRTAKANASKKKNPALREFVTNAHSDEARRIAGEFPATQVGRG
jgi:hypothetical protein